MELLLLLLQIFSTMRVERPELLEKVHPIRADYSAIDLDIDAADRAMLSSEVQVSIAIRTLDWRSWSFVACFCWQFNQ